MFDRRKLQAQMVLRGMNMEDLSSQLNLNVSTVYRKMSSGEFSRSEITEISDILKMTSEDIINVFFAPNVAPTQ